MMKLRTSLKLCKKCGGYQTHTLTEVGWQCNKCGTVKK